MRFKFVGRFSLLNEGYNIPYSGWVVINKNNEFLSKEFLDSKNVRKMWTEYPEEAAVYKDENRAYSSQRWCYEYYDGKEDFWVRHMESNKEEDKAIYEQLLSKILNKWEEFVTALVDFQKIFGYDSLKQCMYSTSHYSKKYPVPAILVELISSDDAINNYAKNLGAWVKALFDKDKDKDTPEAQSQLKKLVDSWKNFVEEVLINKSSRRNIAAMLKDNTGRS